MTTEQLIQTYYSAWEIKEWSPIDNLLADDFTFVSPDDHDRIGKSVFKTKCWQDQVNFIDRFDLECMLTDDTQGFAKYLCHTTKGPSFRNVEYFQFANGKISAIECYFAGQLGYPSVSATGTL